MNGRTQGAAAEKYPLSTIKQAAAPCIALKIPVFIWGGVGTGKTSAVRQLCEEIGARMYGLNLSTMEPTDVGGHPHPVEFNGRKILDWIQSENHLPFVTPERTDEVCIVFADEIDRAFPQTQNPFMNLMWEREINGRKLVPSCSFICAGNGVTDSHTTPISKAMATRGVHFYVRTSSPEALESWDGWAADNEVPSWVRGFARYRQQLIIGDEVPFPELQLPSYRTLMIANRLIDFCGQVPWGDAVVEPLVFGSVGQVVGREMLAFRQMFANAPAADEIKNNPDSAPLPADIGVMWAIGRYLIDHAAPNGVPEKVEYTRSFARYVLRWPDEPAADWMRAASAKLPSLAGTQEYKRWEKTFRP